MTSLNPSQMSTPRFETCYTSDMNESMQTDVLDPFTACLTLEVAERIVQFRADAPTQARVDELAGKANEGQLSPQERALLGLLPPPPP
jgi:hypothetical protein